MRLVRASESKVESAPVLRSFHRWVEKSRGSCLFIEIIGQNHDTITFITKNKVKKSKKIVKITSRLRIVRTRESILFRHFHW